MMYITRHGQSKANVDRVFAGGRVNSPLTDKGRLQAEELGEKVKDLGIDLIVSSPMDRAFETAKIVREVAGVEAEIKLEKGIEEFDVGELAGKPLGVSGEEFWTYKGMEDADDFRERVIEAIERWSKSGKNILFVAHNGVIRVLETKELGLPPKEFRGLESHENASVKKIDLAKLK